MFRGSKIAFGFLVATVFWAVVLVLLVGTSRVSGYLDANGVIALAAVATAAFTGTLYWNALDQLTHSRRVERAYVKISHPAPGIEQLDSSGHIWLTVSVKNFGRTPAKVTNVILRPVVVPHGEPLPA